jgi:hypothetical protein
VLSDIEHTFYHIKSSFYKLFKIISAYFKLIL